MAKAKQQFLFGDADQVYNTLSIEATIIKEEMKAIQKKINNAQTVLAILNNRKNEIEHAMDLLVKKDKRSEDQKRALAKKKDETVVEEAVKKVKKEKEEKKK